MSNEGQRTLLIDDDRHQLLLMSRWLRDAGITSVETSTSGSQASQLIGRANWNLVVSDLQLPGLDGLELLRQFRTLQPLTPFMLVSGHATLDDATRAVRLSASDLLVKPLERTAFVGAVSTLVANYRATAQFALEHPFSFSVMIRGLSHRLGNEMALLVGHADLAAMRLQQQKASSSDMIVHADYLEAAAGSLIGLLADFNRICGVTSREQEPLLLGKAISRTLQLLEMPLYDLGVEIRRLPQPSISYDSVQPAFQKHLASMVLAMVHYSARLGRRHLDAEIQHGPHEQRVLLSLSSVSPSHLVPSVPDRAAGTTLSAQPSGWSTSIRASRGRLDCALRRDTALPTKTPA